MVYKITEVTKDKVHYENGMELKVHESGILYVLFNTKERWCDKAQVSGFDPKTGVHYFGFWFSSEGTGYNELAYNEEILLEWPNHLGDNGDFRSLSEQNKDQVELFFLPWDMFK